MRKPGWIGTILAHGTVILFCAVILLPLLWLLRVALTNKVTAYKLPPEWVEPRLTNFIEIFVAYPFLKSPAAGRRRIY